MPAPTRHTAAHERHLQPAQSAAHRSPRRSAAYARTRLDARRRDHPAFADLRRLVGLVRARRIGHGANRDRARDRRTGRQHLGARRDRLRRRAPHGDGVGQDHRQGARGADRGRPARRGRPGAGHARSGRCRRPARPVQRAAGAPRKARSAACGRSCARPKPMPRAWATLVQRQLVSRAHSTRPWPSATALRAQLVTAQRNAQVASDQLRIAANGVDNTIVRAPFAGVVIAKAAQPGEIVSPLVGRRRFHPHRHRHASSTWIRWKSKSTSAKPSSVACNRRCRSRPRSMPIRTGRSRPR